MGEIISSDSILVHLFMINAFYDLKQLLKVQNRVNFSDVYLVLIFTQAALQGVDFPAAFPSIPTTSKALGAFH